MNKRKLSIYRIVMIVVLGAIVSFCSCGDATDEGMIESRLEDLEIAINDNDLNAFEDCFDTSQTSYQIPADFDQTDLNNIHNQGNYDFHGYSINVNGSNATVNCTATITDIGSVDEATYFELVKSSDDWYITLWQESGTDMFLEILFMRQLREIQ